MADQTQQQLRQAYELIKSKQRQEAVNLLLPILRADETNANAWWLLANAVTEPNDIREALEKVLELRPNHENARKMLDQLNRRFPPPTPQPEADTFGFGDSEEAAAETFGAPASGTGSNEWVGGPAQTIGAPGELARKPKTGTGPNPAVIILAVVGGVAILACIACVVLASSGVIAGFSFLGGVSGTLESEGFFSTIQAVGTLVGGTFEFNTGDGSLLPSGVIPRGSLGYGEARRDTLQVGEEHAWTMTGSANDLVVIDMVKVDQGDLDPFLALYGPDNRQLATDDDSGDGYNARLEFRLPSSGTYTIVARSFSGLSSGVYDLRLGRQ